MSGTNWTMKTLKNYFLILKLNCPLIMVHSKKEIMKSGCLI